MRATKIVTSFIRDNDKLLILKRSDKVKSMKGLWAGISGIIENNEEPLTRAKIEIFEEVGITEDKINLIKATEEMRIDSPQYKNHEWEIFPFLFEANNPYVSSTWDVFCHLIQHIQSPYSPGLKACQENRKHLHSLIAFHLSTNVSLHDAFPDRIFCIIISGWNIRMNNKCKQTIPCSS